MFIMWFLYIRRCVKVYYNPFNIHILSSAGSFGIFAGIGFIIELFKEKNSGLEFAVKIFLLYCSIMFIVLGVVCVILNIRFAYKKLGSWLYAVFNIIAQFEICIVILLTAGIFLFVGGYLFKKLFKSSNSLLD